jgi:spore germination protein KB
MATVRPFETMLLSLITLPVMGHLFLVSMFLQHSGRDTWISVLISLCLMLPLTWVFAKMVHARSGLELSQRFRTYPHLWRGFFQISFVFYNVLNAIVSSTLFLSFVRINFLPNTPPMLVNIPYLLLIAYSLSKDIKVTVWMGSLLATIAMLTGLSVSMIDHSSKDWSEWLPILENGWSPVFEGLFITGGMWTETLALLIQLRSVPSSTKTLFRWWSLGICLNAFMMVIPAMGSVSIYGLEMAQNFLYPSEETLRSMEVILIDRFDTYGLALAAMGSFIRTSLFLQLSGYTLAEDRTWSIRWKYILFLSVACVSIYCSASFLRTQTALTAYTWSSGFAIVLMALAICDSLRGRRTPSYSRD